MAFAQMNWGRMRFPLADPRMSEFSASLAEIYRLAEHHKGFIWRISDADATTQLTALGFDDKISATVSVWKSVEDLKDYTFQSRHADFLERAMEWFEAVDGPQLVIWEVDSSNRPSFSEAFDRLDLLKKDGPSNRAFGWPS